jgi:hypothetical protein
LDAVEKVGVPVQRLSLRQLARSEFAKEFDVVGRRERSEHRSHLFCAACAGQFAVVVGERVVNRVEPSAGCGRVELAGLLKVVPEDDRMPFVAVWPRRKQVTWSDDRCARPSRVPGDCEFPFDVGRIDTGSAARNARDDRGRPEVNEHVPRLAQDDRLLAVHPVGISDGDSSFDCTHEAIVSPNLLDPVAAPIQGALDCASAPE